MSHNRERPDQSYRETGTQYFNLCYVLVHQSFITYLRYPANVIGGLIGSVGLFAMIFYGGQAAGFQALADSTAGLIIGYLLFMLAGSAYQGMSSIVTDEADWGTLERHFVSPFGFVQVLLLKGVAQMIRQLLVSTVVLIILMAITGEWFSVPVFTTLFILSFTLIAVFGIGLSMGGLAVLYKRVGRVTQLLQFAIIGFVGAPILDAPWLRVLPIVQGSTMLQDTITRGMRLWEFPPLEVTILVAVGLGYFIPGVLGFKLLHCRARDLGVLGDY